MLPKTLPYDNNISLVEKNKKKEPKSYAAPNASEASSSQVNSKSRQLQAKNTIINIDQLTSMKSDISKIIENQTELRPPVKKDAISSKLANTMKVTENDTNDKSKILLTNSPSSNLSPPKTISKPIMKKNSSLRKTKPKVEFAQDPHTIAKMQEDVDSLSPDSFKKFYCRYSNINTAPSIIKFTSKPKRLESDSLKSAEDSSYFMNED